jgi:hypothetical protein
MNQISIWLMLACGCHQSTKGAASAPGDEEGGAGASADDSVETPQVDSGGLEPSGSGDTGSADSNGSPSWPGSELAHRQTMVDGVVVAAQEFLASLDDLQRGQVQYTFDHPERADWSNLPHAVYTRQGVSFRELNEERMALGWELIRVSLSAAGLERAQNIVQMEKLLWEDGDMNAFPGNYFFTFFDEPSADTPWGWQLDGHHLALNFTVVGSEVTIAPSLWGTTPKTWPVGEHAGLSPMAAEEDLAFEWMANLNEDQRALAQLGAGADPDLMAGPTSIQDEWPEPLGIPVTALDSAQRERLLDWIAIYVGNLSESQAAERMAEIEEHLGDASVAWMGGTSPGSMMYYRIQGSHVLIEFDHTRSADHAHAVYRDPTNDYGVNWLGKHLKEHHSEE